MEVLLLVFIALGIGAALLLSLIAIVVLVYYCRSGNRRGYEYIGGDVESKSTTSIQTRDNDHIHLSGQSSRSRDLRSYLSDNVRAPPSEQVQQKQRSEEALLNAQRFLRSEGNCTLEKPLPGIGGRKYKHYFLVKDYVNATAGNRSGPSVQLILSIVSKGEHCAIEIDADSKRATFVNILTSIKNPYILPTVQADYLHEQEQIAILRPYCPKGSLKDAIYKATLRNTYAKKYTANGTKLKTNQIQLYGRQILEGLRFFKAKGIPYGHLNSANVMMDNGVCRLTEYENGIINVVPLLQPFFVALQGRDYDVISFGFVLFEMAMGFEINNPGSLYIPAQVPKPIKLLLTGIFGEESSSNVGFKTVDDLIADPFFAEISLKEYDMKKTRIDTKGKEMLRLAARTSINGKEGILKDTRPGKSRGRSKSKRKNSASPNSSRLNSTNPPPSSLAKSVASAPPPTLSNTTATSPAFSPPAAPISSPPPPIGGAPPPSSPSSGKPERGRLLTSITGFDKGKLSKSETNDRSSPKQIGRAHV